MSPDSNTESKEEVLRVFGCFGAIDPFILRKIKKEEESLKSIITSNKELEALMIRNHKLEEFNFFKDYNSQNITKKDPSITKLKEFFDELRILNETFSTAKDPMDKNHTDNIFNMVDEHMIGENTIDRLENIDFYNEIVDLLKPPSIINLNNLDELLKYTTETTFKA